MERLLEPDYNPYADLLDWLARLAHGEFGGPSVWLADDQTRTNVLLVGGLIVCLWMMRRGRAGEETKGKQKREKSPLRRGAPTRVPFLDRPKRPLLVGYSARNWLALGSRRAVTVALDISHFLCAGGTRSGKSAVLSALVDGAQPTLALCFDIALPVVAATRRLQRKIMRGKFRRIPVYVWRANPPEDDPTAVKLRILDGTATEVMSNLQAAFKVGGNGHWQNIVWRIGTASLLECDRTNRTRGLLLLAEGLEAIAKNEETLKALAQHHDIVAGVEWDRNTREACFSWASKFRGLKAMLGEAEGPDGVDLARVLEQGGTFVVELNTFSVSDAARALGPLFLGLGAYAIDKSRRGVNFLLDEGNQLGDRIEQLDKIFTASGARGGRVGLAVQKPLKYTKDLASNIDVTILFGFGTGAIDELNWASKTAHGMVPPEGFVKQRRTAAARLGRVFGRLPNLMNRECYVVHEGAIEGPVTVPEPSLGDLLYYDWPNNRGELLVDPNLFGQPVGADTEPLDDADESETEGDGTSATPCAAGDVSGVAGDGEYDVADVPEWLPADEVLINYWQWVEMKDGHRISRMRRAGRAPGRPQVKYDGKYWQLAALMKALADGLDLREVKERMGDNSNAGATIHHKCRDITPILSQADEYGCIEPEHTELVSRGSNTLYQWKRKRRALAAVK